ncbi:MAG: phenylalanine--tRNA ligase subunit beta [Sphingobacteriia bacterium]|nr:phenylalanine--tRNA ligase subunit beta [Sphingobacteriia bacterium]
MKISLQWLQKYLPELDLSPEVIAEKLTGCGLEVEHWEQVYPVPGGLVGLVVGKVEKVEAHPDADRLKVCQVDIGVSPWSQIVCGASNVAEGQTVIVALPGAYLPAVDLTLKKSKIRGVFSEGMICALDEMGLGEDHSGILVLDSIFPPGTPAAQALGLTADVVFEIGLTPNRSDAASHLGVARDLAAVLELSFQYPDVPALSRLSSLSVQLEVPQYCSQYCVTLIEDIQPFEIPEEYTRWLKVVGAGSISPIVDITNYFCLGWGQPLHAFDADKVVGNISIRLAQSGEEMLPLFGDKIKFKGGELIIADSNGPIALAGIMGGKETGVTSETRRIILESACFHPEVIRKGIQSSGINSEASFRFARGTDPSMASKVIQVASYLLQQLSKGKITARGEALGEKQASAQFSFSLSDFERISGMSVPPSRLEKIMNSLEVEWESEPQGWRVTIPAYRIDVKRPQDLYEEFLRILGYDQVPLSGVLPSAVVFPIKDQELEIRDSISIALAAWGWREILTNSLVSQQSVGEQGVKMKNPLSEEHAALRESLLPSGLAVISHNANRKQATLKLFEWGKVYSTASEGYSETLLIGLFITGARKEGVDQWREKSTPADWFTLSGVYQWIAQQAHANWQLAPITENPELAYGWSIQQGNQSIGKMGLVSEILTKQADIRNEVYYLEVEAKALFKAIHKHKPVYQELPRFPSVKRDLSLVIPAGISFHQIETLILKTDSKLIREVHLFDQYQSKENGQVSYSISILLQDLNETLTDSKIEGIIEKILQKLEKELGVTLRAYA